MDSEEIALRSNNLHVEHQSFEIEKNCMMINDFLNFCQFNDNQKPEEKDLKLVLSDMLKPKHEWQK